MEIESPKNAQVLATLRASIWEAHERQRAEAPVWRRLKRLIFHKTVELYSPPLLLQRGEAEPWLMHPEVSDRIWQLAAAMPKDCGVLVYSRPALVHPTTQIIFAFGMGNVYFLRPPPRIVAKAVDAGALVSLNWMFGQPQGFELDLGHEWVGGRWLASEPEWMLAAYDYYGTPSE